MVLLAGLIGCAAGGGGVLLASPSSDGLALSQLLRDSEGGLPPPGPVIVLTGATLFVLSVLFAPSRGVLAGAYRQWRLRARVQREHLLRSLYELTEGRGRLEEPTPLLELATRYRTDRWTSWRTLSAAERSGLIETHGEAIRFTPSGAAEAARLTRVHRLWELFLVRHADIAADHVDRDADDVEHLLPAELIEELETELSAEGVLPSEKPAPPSPHRIEV